MFWIILVVAFILVLCFLRWEESEGLKEVLYAEDDEYNEYDWEKDEPTERQLAYLKKLRCPKTPKTKGDASTYITRMKLIRALMIELTMNYTTRPIAVRDAIRETLFRYEQIDSIKHIEDESTFYLFGKVPQREAILYLSAIRCVLRDEAYMQIRIRCDSDDFKAKLKKEGLLKDSKKMNCPLCSKRFTYATGVTTTFCPHCKSFVTVGKS
jgi:hypothetical protein